MDHHINSTDLFNFLDQYQIRHTTTRHEAIFTVEQGAHIKEQITGGHTKNLFLKDKKGKLFLICALGETQINLNQLHKSLDCKRLSFGNADLLFQHLGVKPGSVCLFSILNDIDAHISLILDIAMLDHEWINFHPLENTATTTIKALDMEKFAVNTGHVPVWIDFSHNPPKRIDQSQD